MLLFSDPKPKDLLEVTTTGRMDLPKTIHAPVAFAPVIISKIMKTPDAPTELMILIRSLKRIDPATSFDYPESHIKGITF